LYGIHPSISPEQTGLRPADQSFATPFCQELWRNTVSTVERNLRTMTDGGFLLLGFTLGLTYVLQ
jgi:hypothetical protein